MTTESNQGRPVVVVINIGDKRKSRRRQLRTFGIGVLVTILMVALLKGAASWAGAQLADWFGPDLFQWANKIIEKISSYL